MAISTLLAEAEPLIAARKVIASRAYSKLDGQATVVERSGSLAQTKLNTWLKINANLIEAHIVSKSDEFLTSRVNGGDKVFQMAA